MDGSASAVEEIEALVGLPAEVPVKRQAIEKVRYTHTDIIDFILAHPGCRQKDIAARYGYTQAWVSQVMSSDAFQSAFAKRRAEVVDPALTLSIDERFRALTIQSLERLHEHLDRPDCKPEIALRAAELGAKSLGVGGHAPPPPSPADSLTRLAERLVQLNRPQSAPVEVFDGEAQRIE